MCWLVKMTHVDHIAGTTGELTLKMHYRSQGLAIATAKRLSFIRKLPGDVIAAECVAVAIPYAGGVR